MPTPKKLLIATGSQHKFAELSAMLDLPNTELVSLTDAGIADGAEETGTTFEENARIKGQFYWWESGLPTLADDSGIEVDALDGRPGVYTRRYAGPDATDADNNSKLLGELNGVPAEQRGARYQCVLVLVEDGDVLETTYGTFEGRVASEERGAGGFGYDPLFEPSNEAVGGRTVGQMPQDEKNQVSHRALAARAMRAKLIERGY